MFDIGGMVRMRSNTKFPIEDDMGLCDFLRNAWRDGWLDEYSADHFLIKAIENRLTTFVGKEQLIENNINLQGIINEDGSINTNAFNLDFCTNFSLRMQALTEIFGNKNIKGFITNQMSAGKKHYNEDTFFEALSEVSILSLVEGDGKRQYMNHQLCLVFVTIIQKQGLLALLIVWWLIKEK